MIQEFSVRNYLSFGEKQTISFEATSDTKYQDELTVEVAKGVRLHKLVMIFGANASGKSNILYAIQTVWGLLYNPIITKREGVSYYFPFRLRKDEPTEFEIIFYIQTVKYHYRVEYNHEGILMEELFYYPEGRRATFYIREKQKISFGSTLKLSKTAKDALISNTLENHTVLSTYGKTNLDESASEISKLYEWIKDNVYEMRQRDKLIDIIRECEQDKKLKEFMLKSLAVSDYNIIDFYITEIETEHPKLLIDFVNSSSEITDSMKEQLLRPTKEDIEFVHYTSNGTFTLSGRQESAGTLQSMFLARKFYDLVNTDCIWLVDEIGSKLHQDLTKHNLLTFIRNSRNSQLILTSHNQFLLDEDYVRRDMVWLVEKSKETAESELISVDDFSLHKNSSIFNFYHTGKLGAIPNTGPTLLEKD